MDGPRVLPAGDRAVLVELDSPDEVRRLTAAVDAAGFADDVVPAERTVLVLGPDPAALRAALARLDLQRAEPAPSRVLRVPVVYDGADLPEVALAAGLTVEEVIARHCAARYTVAFLGFTRGFPYLVGTPPELHLGRRATPRTVVPAGSVAVAAGYTGIYPMAGPGGWHLLGRTTLPVFDPDRWPPALLAPGDEVEFVPA